MTNIPALNVRVNVDASGVATGVTAATQGLNQISARASRLTGTLSSLKTTMLGVFGGNLLTGAVFALGRELNGMKQETIDLETSTVRLNQSLTALGITGNKAQQEVFDIADAYFQLGFQGSEAITAMGTLVTATRDVEQSTKLMAMSADLARYNKNIGTIDNAAKILARGTQGSAKAFKELGITLDTTIPKNKAIAKAFDELNARIGGQAQAYTKTFAGQMAILKERFDQTFQAISSKVLPVLALFLRYITANGTAILIYGGIVVSVIAIIKTYGATMATIKTIQQAYAFWTYAQAASTNVFRFALSALWTTMKANPVGFIVAAVIALGVAFVAAWNKFKGFREAIVKGIQIMVNGFGYLIGAIATALNALGKIPGFGWAKEAGANLDKAANGVRNYSNSLDALADKKIKAPSISGIVKPGDPTGIKGNIVGGDKTPGSGGGGGGTVQYVTVYASNTNDIAKKLSKAAKNGTPIGGGK